MIKGILMRPLACSGAASLRCRKSLGRACLLYRGLFGLCLVSRGRFLLRGAAGVFCTFLEA